MATFVYDAVDSAGRSVKGKVDADNEQVVLAKLHEQHFHVVSLNEARASFKIGAIGKTGRVITAAAVIGLVVEAIRNSESRLTGGPPIPR